MPTPEGNVITVDLDDLDADTIRVLMEAIVRRVETACELPIDGADVGIIGALYNTCLGNEDFVALISATARKEIFGHQPK